MNSEIDIELASELRTAVARLTKKLRRATPTGLQLSMTERSTMGLLQQHTALLPSELASMEMITNQSMSQVLAHLFELGYIIRTPSQTDKRKINVSLSKQGENTLVQFRHEKDEWLAKAIMATCTPAEQALLKKVIVPLTKLVDFK